MSSLELRMRRARMGAGLSQRDLARAIGVTHGAVGHWETGRSEPSAGTLTEFARVTHIDLHWLLLGRSHVAQEMSRGSLTHGTADADQDRLFRSRLMGIPGL